MGWRWRRRGLPGGGAPRSPPPLLLLLLPLLLLLLVGRGAAQKRRCPYGCYCSKDTAICDRVKEIPRDLPGNLIYLNIFRSGITEILEGSFQHVPSLQLL